MNNKKLIIISVLSTIAVLVLLLLSYNSMIAKQTQRFNQGQQSGYDFLFQQILQTVEPCQTYRMAFINETGEQVTHLVAWHCLNTGEQG